MSTDTEVASPLVELDAHEFGAHVSQGGWRLGLLVARSVAPGTGDPSVPHARRLPSVEGKVSMVEFARLAFGNENADKRVRRYYDGWERAATKGKVPFAGELAPGEEPNIEWETLPDWRTVFADPSSLTNRASGGTLNLSVHLGQYGDKQNKAHKRLLHFVVKEMADKKPTKDVREQAGRYAGALEAEAKVLRRVEAGEKLDLVEVKQELDPSRFFITR